MQYLFHIEQAAGFITGKLHYRDPCPHTHHLSDVLSSYLWLLLFLLTPPFLFQLLNLIFDLNFSLAQFRSIIILLGGQGGILILAYAIAQLFGFLQGDRHGPVLNAHPG
jgi:hypothetical protein